ncbi:MAG: glycosyl hydrolase family 8 [Akkermansiaceae bacterium]
MRRPLSIFQLLLTVLLVKSAVLSDAPARNLFNELLGKTEQETTARIEAAWLQLTRGDQETERIYFEAPNDTAYIADIGNGDVRSEGMSYGMMIAAQLDRQNEFDRLWKWAFTHMRHADGPRRGYFAWQCAFDGRKMDPGSASDGEEWIAMALLFADHRWGSKGVDYAGAAQELLREMRLKPATAEVTPIFDSEHRQVVFVPNPQGGKITDPSYHLPAFYELWARWDRDPESRAFWSACAAESRAFFRRAAHPETGLMPEYSHFDGKPFTSTQFGEDKDVFGFDAWRTLAHVALDHAWGSGDEWQVEQSNRVLRFLTDQPKPLVNRYTLDGKPYDKDPSTGLLAVAGAAGVAADPELAKPFVAQLWDAPVPTGKWRYYNGLLHMLALLQVSGRFQIHEPPAREAAFDSFSYTGRDLPAALPPGHYRNPILTGFFPDPSICRAGDDYYLVNSTFAYFPGLPVFHSKDLVNWTLLGHAIDRPGQLDYNGIGVTRGLFAPAIEHHKGVFYLVCTMVGGIGNFVLTADNPAGPWSDPVALDFPGIDPSLFFDDDDRVWIVHNGEAPDNKPLDQGHRAVWLREFDPAAKRMIGGARLLVNGGVDLAKKPVWIEGPHLIKRDGWYYLNCAEGGTSIDHSQVIFRSRSLSEPFLPWSGNPILTQRDLDPTVPGAVTCTGHADLVEGPGGQWWSVFLGCRPMPDGGQLTAGRETFLLPVTWTADGWPQILPAGKRVPLVAPGPSPATSPPTMLNGDFTFSDSFEGSTPDPFWLMLRAPGETPEWRMHEGKLRLTAGSAGLSGNQHPAFLSRRVQHARFTVATTLEVPAESGVTSGLALFQSEKNHYFLAVRRTDDGTAEILVELANGGPPAIIHRAPAPAGGSLTLRMRADLNALDLEWSDDGMAWKTFTPPDGIKPVTVDAAGGGLHFTGAVVGMHTRRTP